jgi:hypothetical protein
MQRSTGPRVVGLSLPPRRGASQLRGVMAYGLEELDHTLHARVRTAFEDRQAGYVNEVRAVCLPASSSYQRASPVYYCVLIFAYNDLNCSLCPHTHLLFISPFHASLEWAECSLLL